MHCWQIYSRKCSDFLQLSSVFIKKIQNPWGLELLQSFTSVFSYLIFTICGFQWSFHTYKGSFSFPSWIWLAPHRNMKFSALPGLWQGNSFTAGTIHNTTPQQNSAAFSYTPFPPHHSLQTRQIWERISGNHNSVLTNFVQLY